MERPPDKKEEKKGSVFAGVETFREDDQGRLSALGKKPPKERGWRKRTLHDIKLQVGQRGIIFLERGGILELREPHPLVLWEGTTLPMSKSRQRRHVRG